MQLISSAPKDADKDALKLKTHQLLTELRLIQKKIHEKKEYGVLVILQGMDASGKDGVVKNLFTGLYPKFTSIYSFKAPTPEERAHDFLWRLHLRCPSKGMIHVFNRSYYEDLLVPDVHHLLDKKLLKNRYDHINNFEQMLTDEGIVIIKFYLNISFQEQKSRFDERLKSPDKKWKYNTADPYEARFWRTYYEAYSRILKRCNEPAWDIIPSDQKWYRDYCITDLLVKRLSAL